MKNKNTILVNTIKYLQDKYGSNSIVVQDYWEDDDNAIGIIDEKKKRLAYISPQGKQKDGLFYVALEELTHHEDFPYKNAGEFGKLSFDEMEVILVDHFRLNIL